MIQVALRGVPPCSSTVSILVELPQGFLLPANHFRVSKNKHAEARLGLADGRALCHVLAVLMGMSMNTSPGALHH